VARDVVGHREQLAVHEILGAGDHRVAPWIARPREPRDQLRQPERALQLVDAADDGSRGGLFGLRLLGGDGGRDCGGGGKSGGGGDEQHATHGFPSVESGGAGKAMRHVGMR
jgi:hypothetical protein